MTDSDQPSAHALGLLAALAALAYEWRQRDVGRGHTWAGLWRTDQRGAVRTAIDDHCDIVDAAAIRRLVRAGRLPGVRDTTRLIAVLVPPHAAADDVVPPLPDDPAQERAAEEQLPGGIPSITMYVTKQRSRRSAMRSM